MLFWNQALCSLVSALLCETKDAQVAGGVLNSGCCGTFTGLGAVCSFSFAFLGFWEPSAKGNTILPAAKFAALLQLIQSFETGMDQCFLEIRFNRIK